ncbi:universal stress protein [Nonomuraea sp. FMUSA5-5]|uniref:Universal stress protein n=1 Tax=Nonomuraea composti TaxID=2720023 RepID=A0ABX1BBB5_9ACTN|nr:universal stress protein [Nonomuraea sp. FMUSA5-5]NJP95079.1 universal stress protein [Nonomuraea sp. FMUSA5-5]
MSPVIVGVDDSEAGLRAVEWAAGEAVRRRLPLEIVHGFSWPRLGVPLGPAPGAPAGQGGLRHAAERIVATALDRAQAVAPGLDVTAAMMEQAPASALLRRSHHAELLVVGSRGLGKIGGLVLESVGAELATRAPCPVVVVRGSVTPRGPVVVGMDDRHDNDALIAFAFAHAARTANVVTFAHVSGGSTSPTKPTLPAHLLLSSWYERFPEVAVVQEDLTGRPGRTLVRTAQQASLLVVGSRHHSEFGALMKGSVSQTALHQAALHQAACPVAIISLHP